MSTKKSTYQVIKTDTLIQLEKEINIWLRHGWRLQGGIAYTHGGKPVQAITRIILTRNEI